MGAYERSEGEIRKKPAVQQEMDKLISHLPESDEIEAVIPEHLFPLPDARTQASEEESEQPRSPDIEAEKKAARQEKPENTRRGRITNPKDNTANQYK